MKRTRTLTALLAGALLALGLLAPATGPALAAPEPGKFTVSTTVTAAGGAPAQVYVSIFKWAPGYWSHQGNDYFPDGQVRLALSPGDYRFQFVPVDPSLAAEYYDNRATLTSATTVTVADDVTLVPVELARPPVITGRVVTATGAPVRDAEVHLYPADSRAEASAWAYTEPDGTFRARPPAGSWKIQVRAAGKATEWHHDAPSHAAATAVALATSDVALGDIVVGPGRAITGRLVSADGAPAQRMEVTVHDADGQHVVGDRANSDGRYRLPRLTAGSYRLRFSDPYGEFPTVWYGGGTTFDTATPVELGADHDLEVPETVVGEAVRPVPAGTDLTGVVRDAAGRPLMDVTLHAVGTAADGSDRTIGYAITNRAGRYHFTQLDRVDPRTYRVYANPPANWEEDELGHLESWHGGDTSATADPVTVTPGEVTEGVDVALPAAAGLSGRVTDRAGDPVPWVAVELFDEHGDGSYSTQTDGEGRYFVNDVLPGSYYVRFWPDEGVPEWHPDAWMSEARPVSLRGGAWTRLDARVSDRLEPRSAPAISGPALVGRRLTVSPGRWNASSYTTYEYAWRRGSVLVGRGPAYTPKAADAGRRLTVTVSASHPWYPAGSTTVHTEPVRHASTTRVKATPGKARSVRLAVAVGAAVPPAGRVTVKDGNRVVATADLARGRATVTLRRQEPGTHRYTVAYAGSAVVAPSARAVAVKVRG